MARHISPMFFPPMLSFHPCFYHSCFFSPIFLQSFFHPWPCLLQSFHPCFPSPMFFTHVFFLPMFFLSPMFFCHEVFTHVFSFTHFFLSQSFHPCFTQVFSTSFYKVSTHAFFVMLFCHHNSFNFCQRFYHNIFSFCLSFYKLSVFTYKAFTTTFSVLTKFVTPPFDFPVSERAYYSMLLW